MYIEAILNKNFPYFQKLSPHDKELFTERLQKFLAAKSIEGRKELSVNVEMEVITAAVFVQITFRLAEYLLSDFQKIILYPDKFISPFTGELSEGEVNPEGAIVFSWPDLYKGINDANDRWSPGLHQLALALFHSHVSGKNRDRHFSIYFDKWYTVARKSLEQVNHEESFFRHQEIKSLKDFFALGTVYFFEDAKAFHGSMPDLYYHFTQLYRQDPLLPDFRPEFGPKKKTAQSGSGALVEKLTPHGFSWFIHFLFFLLISLMLGTLLDLFTDNSLVTFIVAPAVSGLIFGKLQTIYLTEKMLTVSSFFGYSKSEFPLDTIVSVNYFEGRRTTFLEVNYWEEGFIQRKTYDIDFTFKNMENIFSYLLEKEEIAIRKDYKIYIL